MRKQAGSDRQRNYRSVRGDLEEQAERSKQPDPAEKLRSRLRERGRDDEGEAYRAGPSSELGSSGKHAIGRKSPGAHFHSKLARPAGFEPAASGLEVPCSIQLS